MNFIEFESPFYHAIYDDFLPQKSLNRLKEFYRDVVFREIHSDLFRFLQSQDLSRNSELKFLTNELDSAFKRLHTLDSRGYDVFASFYRAGDYLRCHDDMIDKRVYAFSFYLEDFEGGELVLYNKDCVTEHKRISVKRNRLVIFKVCSDSFHEVLKCTTDGRMAITGWFTHPSQLAKQPIDHRKFFVPENINWYELPESTLQGDMFTLLEFEDVETKELKRELSGPLTDRRCTEIHLEEYFIPSFPNYELVHVEYLHFDCDSYLLTNDKVNAINGNILDVFIFYAEKHVDGFVTLVNSDGNIVFRLDATPNHMCVGHRGYNLLCIPNCSSPVILKHFMYAHKNDLINH